MSSGMNPFDPFTSVDDIRVQALYLPMVKGEVFRRAVFSPEYPDTVVIVYENAPPKIFDLRKTNTQDSYHLVENLFSPVEGWFDNESRITTVNFTAPALDVAYRPSKAGRPEELALVLADNDIVFRFQPRTGAKVVPICFENPCCVAYNNTGDLLAVGGKDGTVTVYDLNGDEDSDGEPVEVKTCQVRGAITGLLVVDDTTVYIATDFNSLFSFCLEGFDPEPERCSMDPEGERTVQALKLNALAWCEKDRLISCGGIGNDIWTFSPDTNTGRPCKVSNCDRILSLQYTGERRLLAFSDGACDVIRYDMDDEGRPNFELRCDRIGYQSEMLRLQMPLVATYMYGNLVCAVHGLPE